VFNTRERTYDPNSASARFLPLCGTEKAAQGNRVGAGPAAHELDGRTALARGATGLWINFSKRARESAQVAGAQRSDGVRAGRSWSRSVEGVLLAYAGLATHIERFLKLWTRLRSMRNPLCGVSAMLLPLTAALTLAACAGGNGGEEQASAPLIKPRAAERLVRSRAARQRTVDSVLCEAIRDSYFCVANYTPTACALWYVEGTVATDTGVVEGGVGTRRKNGVWCGQP